MKVVLNKLLFYELVGGLGEWWKKHLNNDVFFARSFLSCTYLPTFARSPLPA